MQVAAPDEAIANAKVVQALARADLNADTRMYLPVSAPAATSGTQEPAAPMAYPIDGNTRLKAIILSSWHPRQTCLSVPVFVITVLVLQPQSRLQVALLCPYINCAACDQV